MWLSTYQINEKNICFIYLLTFNKRLQIFVQFCEIYNFKFCSIYKVSENSNLFLRDNNENDNSVEVIYYLKICIHCIYTFEYLLILNVEFQKH